MDAVLDRPMTQVLSELSLTGKIRDALNGGGNSFDQLYATLLACEKGDWARLSSVTKKCADSDEQIPDCYMAASKRAGALVT